MMPRCDVAIVGAGPAGSAAAFLLASAGFDVRLLDRVPFPRAKPCGECLSPGIDPFLDALGVRDHVRRAAPARLAGWQIIAPDGSTMLAPFQTMEGGRNGSIAIARSALDQILLDAAVGAGARFLPATRVLGVRFRDDRVVGIDAESDRNPVQIQARLTLGADGLRSVVARRVGARGRPPRRRKISFTMHLAGVTRLADFGEMHLAPGACAGLARVGGFDAAEAVANLTVVAEPGRCPLPPGRDSMDAWRTWLRRFPALRGRLDDARPLEGDSYRVMPMASGPFDKPVRFVAGPGFALIGDAAGYFDPFTGQGVTHALQDAFALAHAAMPNLSRTHGAHSSLAAYEADHDRRSRHAHSLQRTVDAALRYAPVAGLALRMLRRSPTARNALIAATADLLPPSALLSPRLLARSLREAIARQRQ
jgi:menaquinone-9 beta-reductase